MENLDVELVFDSAESCVLKSEESAFLFYVSIKNNLLKQIKVELPLATYLTSQGEEIDQDFWLVGLINGASGATIRSGAHKKMGILIHQQKLKSISTGDRIFITVDVAKFSLRMSYVFVCSDGPQKTFLLHEANKEEIESEISRAHGTPIQSGDALGKQEITNTIERLELLEEKFGIAISGLYATCHLQPYATPPEHHVTINFDVTSLASGELNGSCKVNANAYNAEGQLLATVPSYIKSDFMGFGSMSILAVLDQVPAKIRLFPSGW